MKYPLSVLGSICWRCVLILASTLHTNIRKSDTAGRVPYQRKSGISLWAEWMIALYLCAESSALQHHIFLPNPWSIIPVLIISTMVWLFLSILPLSHEEYVPVRSITIWDSFCSNAQISDHLANYPPRSVRMCEIGLPIPRSWVKNNRMTSIGGLLFGVLNSHNFLVLASTMFNNAEKPLWPVL